jgi:hypothetical protein
MVCLFFQRVKKQGERGILSTRKGERGLGVDLFMVEMRISCSDEVVDRILDFIGSEGLVALVVLK